MRNVTTVLAVLALACTAAMADFTDVMPGQTSSAVVGTVVDSVYTPGIYTLTGRGGIGSNRLYLINPYGNVDSGTTTGNITIDNMAIRTGTTAGAGTYQWVAGSGENWYAASARTFYIFNYQDPSHFYYVLTADTADSNWQYSGWFEIGYANGTSLDQWDNAVLNLTVLGSTSAEQYPYYEVPGSGTPFAGNTDVIRVAWNPATDSITLTANATNHISGAVVYDSISGSNAPLTVTGPGLWTSGGVGMGTNDTHGGLEQLTFTAVPEPATMTMLVLGGIGALLRRRK